MAVRTVKRRGKRRLVVDFSYRKPDGSKGRYRHDAVVQTRAAALAEERRRLAAVAMTGSPFALIDEGAAKAEAEHDKPKAPTLSEAVESFFTAFAPSRLKLSTRDGYSRVLRVHILPRLGGSRLSDIDASAVRELDAALVKAGAAQPTRRSAQVVLRTVLCRYAVEAGLLPEAPRLPKLPKKPKKLPGALSADGAQAIIDAALCEEHRFAFMLAFYAGLRTGEIKGLRVCDIDLEARVLRVRQSVVLGVVDTPKSGHDREVPLTSDLLEAAAKAMKGKPREARVSLTAAGTPWGKTTLRYAFLRAAKRAGIVGSTTHHMRHAFVTSLLDRGVGAHIVQELAGHADLTTTQLYAHVVSKNRRAAIDVLDGLAKKEKPEQPGSRRGRTARRR